MSESKDFVPLAVAKQILGNERVREAASYGLRLLELAVTDSETQRKATEFAKAAAEQNPHVMSWMERRVVERRRAEELNKEKAGCCAGCLGLIAEKGVKAGATFVGPLPGAYSADDLVVGSEALFGIVTARLFGSKERLGWNFRGRRMDNFDAVIKIAAAALPIPAVLAEAGLLDLRRRIEDGIFPPPENSVVENSQIEAKAMGMVRAFELPAKESEKYLALTRRLEQLEDQVDLSLSDQIRRFGLMTQLSAREAPGKNQANFLRAINAGLIAGAVILFAVGASSSLEAGLGIFQKISMIPGQGLEALGPIGDQTVLTGKFLGKTILASGGIYLSLWANPWRSIREISSGRLYPGLGKLIERAGKLAKRHDTK